jgi:LPXTG-motif cell wall-anchored protein
MTSSGSTPTSQPSSALSPNIIPPVQEDKPKSEAWIAGAVVGPILGLALIGLIAWLLIRRRKKKTQYQPAATAEGPSASPATYSQGPNSPPQFYPPPMGQNAGAVPFGVAKHDSWAPGQSAYGSEQRQWQGHDNLNIDQAPPMGGQPGYGALSLSMSPQPGYAQPAQYDTGMYKHEAQPVRPLNELEGSAAHTQPMSELPGAPART